MNIPTFPSRDKWKCEFCLFYRPSEIEHSRGQCRAHPPTTITEDEQDFWPQVSNGDWCGAFIYDGKL